jgi:acetylornithine deacetylase/succinyl-diaminopimelate desuccinylase-like protein
MEAYMLPRALSLVLVAAVACSTAPAPPPAAPAAPWWQQGAWAVAAAAPAGFDRAAAAAETRERLVRLVAIDTRNPPGNELAAAEFLADELDVPGIETHVLRCADGRANLVARLRAAHPTQRPVLILGHMDVVGVDEAHWSTPPLVATGRDGFLYGRGVIDDKGMLAAAVTAVRALAERRDTLTRDIVLLATAGEEGGPEVGIEWVLAEHRDVLGDPEFALNEGGRVRLDGGRVRSVNVQTTEKIAYSVTATARGPSGHGSVPMPQNALAALARAVARVHEWRAPVRLNDVTRSCFTALAGVEPDPERRAAMLALVGNNEQSAVQAAALLSQDPVLNAQLRTAAALTMLDGGFRNNVIPSEGRATFNVRALPDEDILAIVDQMQAAGGELAVSFALEGKPRAAPPASPADTALFAALEAAAHAMVPDAVVTPFMSTGGTDGAALRREGVPTYGILPFPLEVPDELRMHGDNERVPLPALGWGAEFLYRTLSAVATSGATAP